MASNEIYIQVVGRIIKEQENIIGPVALEQAQRVSGLKVNSPSDIFISGNAKAVLESLVKQYEKLFGRASIEVCREAIQSFRPKLAVDDLPAVLQ